MPPECKQAKLLFFDNSYKHLYHSKWYHQKNSSYFVIAIYFFLGGVEYAVILPTVWLYLDTEFHSKPIVLGLVISAFSLAGLLASPFVGRWADVYKNTKVIMLVTNVFEISGSNMYFMGLSAWFLVLARLVAGASVNLYVFVKGVFYLMYLMGLSAWFLVLARLVAGLGSSVYAVLTADIARATTTDGRTGAIALVMACRQFGMLLGPGCNLFLKEFDFSLDPFPVNSFTAPGLFMAAVWMLLEIITLFFFWNLPQLCALEANKILSANNETSRLYREIGSYDDATAQSEVSNEIASERYREISPNSDGTWRDDEREPSNEASINADLLTNSDTENNVRVVNSPTRRYGAVVNTEGVATTNCDSNNTADTLITKSFLYDEYIREEVVVLLFIVFTGFFNQLVIETIATPLTQRLLNWGGMYNSLLYCGAAVQALLMFGAIRFRSRWVSDRDFVLFGSAVLVATDAFYIWFLPQAPPGDFQHNFWGMFLGTFLYLVGVPCQVLSGASLYTKVTRPETQGLDQGVRRVSGGIATILGPLWAGATISNVYLMLGVCLAMNLLVCVMFILSYKHLREKYKAPVESIRNTSAASNEQETSPLLHGNQPNV